MPSNDFPQQTTGTLQRTTSVTYSGPDEKLTMNKYHLLWVIERLQKKAKGPSIEQVLIPFAVFLGLLPALISGVYQERLGIGPSTWDAIVVMFTFLSLIATAILFVWWCAMKCTQHKETPEEVVNAILDQMEKDKKRASGISQTLNPDKGASQP